MDFAQVHRAFMTTCREFVTTSAGAAEEATCRTRHAVSVSRTLMVKSHEMIHRSKELLGRQEQRIIDVESGAGGGS